MKKLIALLLAGSLALPLAAQQPAIICTPTTGGAFRCQQESRPSAKRLAIVFAAIGGGALIFWAVKRKKARPVPPPRPLARPQGYDARLAAIVPGARRDVLRPAR